MHTLIAEKVGLKPPVEKDEIAETGLSNKMIETNGFGKLQWKKCHCLNFLITLQYT